MPGKAGWDGLVDAVRLWNVALSWESVRQNMNDTLHGSEHPSMIGQWSCNEGAGAQCWDSSSRGNHGTLEGDVPPRRVMCTRDRMVPSQFAAPHEAFDASFEMVRDWRVEFEKRVGRPVEKDDLNKADEGIRKTARKLGLL